MPNYSLFPFAPGRFQLSLGHDYALFPPGDAGHLDRRKQASHLAAHRTARQRGAREGENCARRRLPKIKAGCDKWFADLPGLVARQRELEKVLNHDVIGFTTAVAEDINDDASRWFHFGLTSSDVGDTCYAVQMQQSADILIADVKTLLPVIARRANEYKFTPCIGRSHGIHAEPTTFGLKLALMHDEFVPGVATFGGDARSRRHRQTFRGGGHQRAPLAAR